MPIICSFVLFLLFVNLNDEWLIQYQESKKINTKKMDFSHTLDNYDTWILRLLSSLLIILNKDKDMIRRAFVISYDNVYMSRSSKLKSLFDVTCAMTDNFQYPSQPLDIDKINMWDKKKHKKTVWITKNKKN